jgi:lipoate-protein ligase A
MAAGYDCDMAEGIRFMIQSAPSAWRLILSEAACGPWNMALDEAVLESVTAGNAPPTLRLYAWKPACLSIGYAQPLAQADLPRLQQNGWGLVRRPTGGRAILHIDELTYSISLPLTYPHMQGGVLESYHYLSTGLVTCLRLLGLEVQIQPEIQNGPTDRANPVCFEIPSSYEITIRGKKIVGSAQVRRKGALLQHGSLPLKGDIGRICLALAYQGEEQRRQAIVRARQRATNIEHSLGKCITWGQAAEAMRSGFSQALNLIFEVQEPNADEIARARVLCRERYKQRAWTERV